MARACQSAAPSRRLHGPCFRVMVHTATAFESLQGPVWFVCVALFVRVCYAPARSRGRIVGLIGVAFALLVGTFVSSHVLDGACAFVPVSVALCVSISPPASRMPRRCGARHVPLAL